MAYDGEERRKVNKDGNDIAIVLARIDERLANFITVFEKHTKEVEKKFDIHNERIVVLEKGYWKSLGVLAFIIILIEMLLKFIGK